MYTIIKQDQAIAQRIDRHGGRIYLPLIEPEFFTPVFLQCVHLTVQLYSRKYKCTVTHPLNRLCQPISEKPEYFLLIGELVSFWVKKIIINKT